MKKTILITGANGMLGQDAAKIFSDSSYDVIKASKLVLDVTNITQAREVLSQHKVDFVLHTAAYTKVDDAETDRDTAFALNADGTRNIAIATNEKSIPLIYISTDYVFDGEKGSPYFPSDETNPQSVYGSSKLAGEKAVKEENPQHYIVRTSWVYGKHGKNFVDTMITLSKTQKSLRVVNDQFGCPTWTCDLASGIKDLIEGDAQFGTYHICGGGITNWFELAKKIFEILKIDIEVIPVTTSEFPRPAKRPRFSAMVSRLNKNWDESLADYLKTLSRET